MKILAKPVDMIACFNGEGDVEPLRFQIEKEDGERLVIRVHRIISYENIQPAGVNAILFRCQSEIRGAWTLYELKFRVKEHRWELYKM